MSVNGYFVAVMNQIQIHECTETYFPFQELYYSINYGMHELQAQSNSDFTHQPTWKAYDAHADTFS